MLFKTDTANRLLSVLTSPNTNIQDRKKIGRVDYIFIKVVTTILRLVDLFKVIAKQFL